MCSWIAVCSWLTVCGIAVCVPAYIKRVWAARVEYRRWVRPVWVPQASLRVARRNSTPHAHLVSG